MDNSKNFFGTILLGVAVGVAIGILVAPDKGAETRKRLFNGAQDLAEDLKGKIQEGTDKFNDFKEMAEERINDLKERATAYSEKTQKSLS